MGILLAADPANTVIPCGSTAVDDPRAMKKTEKNRTPETKTLPQQSSRECFLTLVAGTGFEPVTFRL
jgi:hypothetical protein